MNIAYVENIEKNIFSLFPFLYQARFILKRINPRYLNRLKQ